MGAQSTIHAHTFMATVLIDDFFVGIGDINSAFLPKVDPLTPSTPSQSPSSPASLDTTPATPPPPDSSPLTPALSSVPDVSSENAIHESPPTAAGLDDEELEKRTMITRNSIALEAQVEERPLAKKQEELEEQEQKEEAQNQSGDVSKSDEDTKGSAVAEVKADVTPQPHRHPAKALLRNDDYELFRVQSVRLHFLGPVDSNPLRGIPASGSSSSYIL